MTIVNQSLSYLSFSLIMAFSNSIQAKAIPGVEAYKPAFFAEYTPQTALDMVERLPGFSLIETDDDIRGFAAGAGNVLINGIRPTTKSGGIREALSRIPATQVTRIEIIRGTAGSSDAAGQAVVANVLRVDSDGAKRWQLSLERSDDGKISPSAELVISEKLKDWDSAFKLNAIQQKSPREAKIFTYSADQQLLQSQIENRPSTLNEVFLSGDSKRQFTKQRQLNLNGRLGWSQFLTDTQRQISDNLQQGETTESMFNNARDSRFYTGELGLEWRQPLSKHWDWRVLSVNNAQNWFVDSHTITQTPINDFSHANSLRFDEHKSEHVLRTMFSHIPIGQQALSRKEYGFETAYSQLDSWLTLWDQNTLTGNNEITRESYSQVEEHRSELFANYTWQLEKMIIEGKFAAEYSRLEVDGDNKDEQSLFFLKPSLSVVYNPSQQTQYRFDLRRSVGQLDFSDFAASADLVNDREFSGNPRLQPETKIRIAIALDHRFAKKGALNIELYHEWRQHVLEQVVLPSGAHALGNAGDANVQGVNTSLNLPLSAWINDAQLSVTANFIDSTFNDPVTGDTRQLTNLSDPTFSADFRQDLSSHRLSWGISYQGYKESEEFFVDEYNWDRTEGYWTAFVESIVFDDVKVRLSARNLGDEKQRWERLLYKDSRDGAIGRREITERRRGPFVNLTFSQAF